MFRGHTRGAGPELEYILDLAEEALDRGDPGSALQYCGQVLDHAPEHPGALFLTGEAHRDLRELDRAETVYRRVTHLTPDHSPSWSALAAVLFDQLRFDEARTAVLRAIREDPRNAEAYALRALVRERHGDDTGADRDHRRAWRLDPEGWPLPIPLPDATVEAVVEEAVQEMHPSIQAYLGQVAILLEEVPSEEICLQYDPPASPAEILGYFSGVPLTERSLDNPWTNLPSAIVLFRRNLQRIAHDRERMIEELRVTVLHEVGHFLGLDEDDLEERGLD